MRRTSWILVAAITLPSAALFGYGCDASDEIAEPTGPEEAGVGDTRSADPTRPNDSAPPDSAQTDASSDGGCGAHATVTDASLPITDVFRRAVISRAYEQTAWVLRDRDGGPDREDAASVAAALAALRPSYISGLVYLGNGTPIPQRMIDDFDTIRTAARSVNPNVKLDVEISLNPEPPAPKKPFADAAALVAQMAAIDCRFHPDAWMFDFYSDAQRTNPEWIAAAISYAHSHGQLVGGNVFGASVPPGSDFAAFVDRAVDGGFGFDFRRTQIESMRQSSPSTLIVGHLQSNAQNGPTTESCVFSYQWDEPTRASYLSYWAKSQADAGFQFIYPVFYPLCPGAIAFDPRRDPAPDGGTLYDLLAKLMSRYNP